MTRVQQVLFELETSYCGRPYYVPGNALFNAISRRVDEVTRRSVCVSHGVFIPGEYGEYSEGHSQDGYAGVLGSSLPAVESYEDLFLYRDPAQRWLLDSRARDAHNTHDLESHGGRTAFAPRCFFGRPAEVRNHKRSVQWYLHCYVHAGRGGEGILPVSADVLDGVRVGGARNYGFGEMSVADTQLVDLAALDYSRLSGVTGGCVLELVTPYVLSSTFPEAEAQSVPWWWGVSSDAPLATRTGGSDVSDGLRRREERLIAGETIHELGCVDHGQVVGYAGNDPVATAKNGVLRVGTHSRYGYGELRVRPAGESRVPERGVQAGGDV